MKIIYVSQIYSNEASCLVKDVKETSKLKTAMSKSKAAMHGKEAPCQVVFAPVLSSGGSHPDVLGAAELRAVSVLLS